MRFRLTPRSMTLDDLKLHKFEFSENFSGFRRFRTPTTAKGMKIDQYCQRKRCKHVELEQFFACFRVARVCQRRRRLGFLVLFDEQMAMQRASQATCSRQTCCRFSVSHEAGCSLETWADRPNDSGLGNTGNIRAICCSLMDGLLSVARAIIGDWLSIGGMILVVTAVCKMVTCHRPMVSTRMSYLWFTCFRTISVNIALPSHVLVRMTTTASVKFGHFSQGIE